MPKAFFKIKILLLAVLTVFFIVNLLGHPETHAWYTNVAKASISITSNWDVEPEYPNWEPNTVYQEGDYVIYNNCVFWAQYWTRGDEPGTHVVWQEVTDEWRWFNFYNQGDIVIFNGMMFCSRYSGNHNKEPGLMSSPWDEITDEWRHFNVYQNGDIVYYNGHQYRARYYNQNSRPDISAAWELIQ